MTEGKHVCTNYQKITTDKNKSFFRPNYKVHIKIIHNNKNIEIKNQLLDKQWNSNDFIECNEIESL